MKYKKFPNEFINSINNLTYKQLSKDNKRIVKTIFNEILDDEVIKIKKIYTSSKKILSFKVNNKIKYVSFIDSECELLYEDGIYHFIAILKRLKFDQKTINNFLLLYWCDFTINNTGKRRLDSASFLKLYPSRLQDVNKKFNDTVNLMEFIELLLFQDDVLLKGIDYLLFKKNDKWNLMSKSEAKIAISMNKNHKNNGLFIGPFCIQSKRRNLDFNKKYEYRRSVLLIRWYYYDSTL